ncbi:MAG: DUF885 domain-containing protein [Pseudomonadota bacterium]
MTITSSYLSRARRARVRWALGGLLCLLLAACAARGPIDQPDPSEAPVASVADANWDRWSADFLEGYFELYPATAVRAGRHEFDGQVPDLSARGLKARVDRLRRYREEARAFAAAALSVDRRFERELAIWYIGRSLFWLTESRWRTQNPMLNRAAVNPSVYLTRSYAPLPVRMAGLTRLLEAMPLALEQIEQQLDAALPRSYLRRSIGYYGGLARHLKRTVPAVFDGIGTGASQAALQRVNADAIAALTAFREALEARRGAATADFALGRDRFVRMLEQREMITEPLLELKALGQRDLERNLQALLTLCREALDTPDPQACMTIAEVGKSLDPVARGRAQLPALKAFVQERDLVTIPSEEEALVEQSPPYNRANLAYISIPGAFEPDPLPSVYYISPPDPQWGEAEQRAFVPNEGRLLYVSVHEVWPGHFLWGLHRNRAERPLVRLFTSTTFSEGWAHYVEEMMHDEGLSAGDPRLHLGQLANALKRNVRYLSAIGMHTEGMTQEESEQRFLTQALLDPGNARQQAARGTYDPGYLSYTLGKLQILKLREDWFAAHPDGTLKAFHDELLSYGGAPLNLIRRYMLPAG